MNELHVVALSGGKDSTAMALRLAEIVPRDYVYVCTPTGREFPEMFDHWNLLGKLLGKRIMPVMGGSLFGIIREERMIPNHRARFCTRKLKIEVYAAWLLQQRQKFGRIISYVGLRADEEDREGGDYASVPDVEMRFPMRDWGWKLADVTAYNEKRGVNIPERTDCDCCFFQRLAEWHRFWKNYPERWAEAAALEREIGHTFRSDKRDSWPASMDGLAARFEKGEIPTRSIAMEQKMKNLQCRVCRL